MKNSNGANLVTFVCCMQFVLRGCRLERLAPARAGDRKRPRSRPRTCVGESYLSVDPLRVSSQLETQLSCTRAYDACGYQERATAPDQSNRGLPCAYSAIGHADICVRRLAARRCTLFRPSQNACRRVALLMSWRRKATSKVSEACWIKTQAWQAARRRCASSLRRRPTLVLGSTSKTAD